MTCSETGSAACHGVNAVNFHSSETLISNKEFDMKKAICAMKAALGVRSIGGCQLGAWRWQYYHNI